MSDVNHGPVRYPFKYGPGSAFADDIGVTVGLLRRAYHTCPLSTVSSGNKTLLNICKPRAPCGVCLTCYMEKKEQAQKHPGTNTKRYQHQMQKTTEKQCCASNTKPNPTKIHPQRRSSNKNTAIS